MARLTLSDVAVEDGELCQLLLSFLGPADLAAVAGCSRLLRRYAHADAHWRYWALQSFGLGGIHFDEPHATRSWYHAFVFARCMAGGRDRPSTRALLDATSRLDASLPPVESDFLLLARQRSTVDATACRPFHVTYDMLSAARASGSPIDPTWMSPPDTLPRLPAPHLCRESFRACVEVPGRPVVITGGLHGWRAAVGATAWTPDRLAQLCGPDVAFSLAHRVGAAHGVELPLRSYLGTFLRYARSPLAALDELPLYVFDAGFGEAAPHLLLDYSGPSIGRGLFPTADDLFGGLGRAARPGFRWLVVGGPRSGTPWHWDPHGTSAWNALLHGTKRWFLYPPGADVPGVATQRDAGGRPVSFAAPMSPAQWLLEVFPHLPLHAKPLELLQSAGDVVFVPSGWWHAVLNMGETVSVTQNFVSAGAGGTQQGGPAAPAQPGQAHATHSSDASGAPFSCVSSCGPCWRSPGNLLEVVTDLAALRSASGVTAAACGSKQQRDTGTNSSPGGTHPRGSAQQPVEPSLDALHRADATKTGSGSAQRSSPSLSAPEGALCFVRPRVPAGGPDPDAHGLTAAPPHVPLGNLQRLPPHEALRLVATAAAARDADPSALCVLEDGFTLACWHTREMASLHGNNTRRPAADAATHDGSQGEFTSHAHFLSCVRDVSLYRPLVLCALAACSLPCTDDNEALVPLTSRTNPAFYVPSLHAVVKLFSPFVCEDGGRTFQPCAAMATWAVEAAVLSQGPAGAGGPQLPRLLGHGVARTAERVVHDPFSPSVPLVTRHDDPTPHAPPSFRMTWATPAVPLATDDCWTWPFLVTAFVGSSPRSSAQDVSAAQEGAVCSLATARDTHRKGHPLLSAAARMDGWYDRVATELAPLLHAFHWGAHASPHLKLQLTRAHFGMELQSQHVQVQQWKQPGGAGSSRVPIDNAGYPRCPSDLLSPVRVPYPLWSHRAPGDAEGVLLPCAWVPYFAKLLSLRVSAPGRRERTRNVPSHLSPCEPFLPPLRQTHVLLPLRTHPVHLPVTADGYVDLASGALPSPALLHGDMSPDNVFGRIGALPEAPWHPTTLIDCADAMLGDPTWDCVALWAAALGGRLGPLAAFAAAYDRLCNDVPAPHSEGGCSTFRLQRDPAFGYRLTCLLLLHPVDACALPLEPVGGGLQCVGEQGGPSDGEDSEGGAPRTPGQSGAWEGSPRECVGSHCSKYSQEHEARESPLVVVPADASLSWGEVAARVAAAVQL